LQIATERSSLKTANQAVLPKDGLVYMPGVLLRLRDIPKDSTKLSIKVMIEGILAETPDNERTVPGSTQPEVMYVDYVRGNTSGIVRFSSSEGAYTALQAIVRNNASSDQVDRSYSEPDHPAELLHGEWESAYWQNQILERAAKKRYIRLRKGLR
jgi:hypothetical protein